MTPDGRGRLHYMAVDISVDDRYVATVGEEVMDWFDQARTTLGVANPFSIFDPYGRVRLDAEAGEVAAFASALQRTLRALDERSRERLPKLPVQADERDAEAGELDGAGIAALIRSILVEVERADVETIAVVGVGD
jgi:hypothetical protein